jgi:hypothetical protein
MLHDAKFAFDGLYYTDVLQSGVGNLRGYMLAGICYVRLHEEMLLCLYGSELSE